ncbi:MAG: hypothetical protein ACTSQZ_01025 [Candidatus Thorarchaeota archaeon]
MSEEMDFKSLIAYLSAVALALFYLVYMPWTAMSAFPMDVGVLWIYYFTLVLGLLFPLYYAIGKENMAWHVLGLSIILNSVVLMLQTSGNWLIAGVMTLLFGVFVFLGPILEKMMADNWDMIKNILHILKGLFIILAVAFYADFNMDNMIGNTSFNHAMPQFLFFGGGLFVAFGVILLAYGLFKLLGSFIGGTIADYFGELSKVFYILMVLVFLLGITFNVAYYAGAANYWAFVTLPTSIEFFAFLATVGSSNLGAILLIILYIYGMNKIVKKNE